MRNNSGITLIAVIITIIIMIILVGVSLNIGIGDNGLINKTGKTANNYNYDTTYEELYAQILEAQAEDIRTEPTIKSVLKYLKNKYGNDEYIIGREKEKAIIVFDDIDDLDDDVDKVVVKYKGYEFEFDSNLKLAIFDNKKDWKTPVLPFAYQQVEYIESTGTQYIDTGFKPTGNTKVKIKVQLPTQTNVQQGIFGARPGDTGHFTVFTGNRGDALQVDYNISESLGIYSAPISNFNAVNVNEIEMSNKLIINDVFVREVNKISFQSSVNLYLFTNNNNGTPQLTMKGMIWYCKIWDNDVLVRNFIPCINQSNVAGMYDTVEGVFYTNAGTGTFEKGDDV